MKSENGDVWAVISVTMSVFAALMLVFAFCFFSGCALQPFPEWPEEVLALETPEAAGHWIYANIRPVADAYEDWKTPERTLADGCGDCEDRAILWLAMCADLFGDEGFLHCAVKGSKRHAYATACGTRWGYIDGFQTILLVGYREAVALAH